jgi:hypothetical protein
VVRCSALLLWFPAVAYAADKVVLVTSQSAMGANDSMSWSGAGKDGTVLGTSVMLSSANKAMITANLAGPNSITSVVCPASSCCWTASGNGFQAGDTLLWTSDAGAGGNGPLTLSFGQSISGAGATIQADAPGQFTASLQVFDGSTGLGTFTVNSDASGDPVYIGALDSTGADITSAVFSLTSCAAGCSDFAIDTVSMAEPVMDFSLSGSTAEAINPGEMAKYTVTILPWQASIKK